MCPKTHKKNSLFLPQTACSSAKKGADSLEVVHGGLPPEGNASNKAGGGRNGAKRGGIHAFGKCYIPYTSQGNREVKVPACVPRSSFYLYLSVKHVKRSH